MATLEEMLKFWQEASDFKWRMNQEIAMPPKGTKKKTKTTNVTLEWKKVQTAEGWKRYLERAEKKAKKK